MEEEFGFNFLAIFVAAVVPMVVGFIWYHPKVLGTVWMNAAELTEEKIKTANMPLIFGLAFVMAIMVALFLSLYVNHGGPEFQTFKHGAFHGALAAVFLGIPVLATNALFDRRNTLYILINAGYWIVSFALMGGILCAWR
ncbi:DUF1761 domain-containing protein [Sphingobacteriales bacterium UPWRP_1]|nr:hypothetical protein B6N25_02225 [Sphingobacteriales bacterium TSM_CSS]PSJ75563.1 DUF1761 domain-containing protein [Sphingobacteriales bacterium UPWRP_1]